MLFITSALLLSFVLSSQLTPASARKYMIVLMIRLFLNVVVLYTLSLEVITLALEITETNITLFCPRHRSLRSVTLADVWTPSTAILLSVLSCSVLCAPLSPAESLLRAQTFRSLLRQRQDADPA